ncbi:MAG: hypothetical protein K2G94_04800, partial [Muribaculaceae bacterium]|nr:hypothetical protein [Muribaculaceae bacterium]
FDMAVRCWSSTGYSILFFCLGVVLTEARPSLISPLTASLSAVFPARGVKTVVQSNEFFGNYASFCTHFYLTQAQKLNPDAFSQSKEKRKDAKEK